MRRSKGETVVSFTFDGTYKGQEVAAQILADHDLAGTFFINSGYIGYPAFLSVDELRSISRNRHEIGGASLYGNDLSDIDANEATQQVCDDRATLSQLGFQVTSFAYPYGTTRCRPSVGRGMRLQQRPRTRGLYHRRPAARLPKAESLPPADDMRIRSAGYTNDVERLKSRSSVPETVGGGWVPLVFTHVCVCPELGDDAISPADFKDLVTWVAEPTSWVDTVDQVMGGDLEDCVGTPLQRLVPEASRSRSSRTRRPLAVPAFTALGLRHRPDPDHPHRLASSPWPSS